MCSGLSIGAREIAGYDYGTLVHSSLVTEKKGRKMYGDGFISDTVEYLSAWAF